MSALISIEYLNTFMAKPTVYSFERLRKLGYVMSTPARFPIGIQPQWRWTQTCVG